MRCSQLRSNQPAGKRADTKIALRVHGEIKYCYARMFSFQTSNTWSDLQIVSSQHSLSEFSHDKPLTKTNQVCI